MRKLGLLIGLASISCTMVPLVSCMSEPNPKNINVFLSDTTISLGFTINKSEAIEGEDTEFIIQSPKIGENYYVSDDIDPSSCIKVGSTILDVDDYTLTFESDGKINLLINGNKIKDNITIDLKIINDNIYHELKLAYGESDDGVTITPPDDSKYFQNKDISTSKAIDFQVEWGDIQVQDRYGVVGYIKCGDTELERKQDYVVSWNDDLSILHIILRSSGKDKLISSNVVIDIKAGTCWKIPVTIKMYDSNDFEKQPIKTVNLNGIDMTLSIHEPQTFNLQASDWPDTSYAFTSNMEEINIIHISMSTYSTSNHEEINFKYNGTALVEYNNSNFGSVSFKPISLLGLYTYFTDWYNVNVTLKMIVDNN